MSEQTTQKLGKLLAGPEPRDAVHIAVVAVVANEPGLIAGTHIGFVRGSTELVERLSKHDIGIVDPFLREPVKKGERFWMFLYPGSITSLRHDWTHPAFRAEAPALQAALDEREQAVATIKRIASEMGGDGDDADGERDIYGPYEEMTYDRLMAAAAEWLSMGEYCVERGGQSWQDSFPYDEFWTAYRIATGNHSAGGRFFSCSC